MPSIYGLVGPIVRQAPPERNETTYYDTPDLRLARWGASLRHRPGEGWTVKLPAERDAPFLVRPEIVFDGNGDSPPESAVELVRAFVRGGRLAQSVHMTTIRRRTEMHDAGGRLIAGVVDDAVSVPNGTGPAAAFRELEVEIGDDMTPDLLDALVERLRQAGAGAPDQTAKYIRALAPRDAAHARDRRCRPGNGRDGGRRVSDGRSRCRSSVSSATTPSFGSTSIRRASTRRASPPAGFAGPADVPPAPRRGWASALRDELAGSRASSATSATGTCCSSACAGAPSSRASERPRLRYSRRSRSPATPRMQRSSTRCAAIATRASSTGSWRPRTTRRSAPTQASRPAERCPSSCAGRGTSSRSARRRSAPSPRTTQLHEVRIRTKRARYAAEAAAPVVGKQARAFAHAAAAAPGRPRRAQRLRRRRRVARRVGGAGRRRGCVGCRSCTRGCRALDGRSSCAAAGARPGRSSPTRSCAPGCDRDRPSSGRHRACATATTAPRTSCSSTVPPTTTGRSRRGSARTARASRPPRCARWRRRRGLRCRLERELATTRYVDGRGRPKTVRYWLMTPVAGELGAANEVDDVVFSRSPRRGHSSRTRATASSSTCSSPRDRTRASHPPCEGEEPASSGRTPTSCAR